MFDFFRKYQWYFFLVITIVVIISFSFFGTYSTLGSDTWREQVAFKAIDGQEVTELELNDLASFLSSDSVDQGGQSYAWGFNFLNDGVIQKDFLETGLAQELVASYRPAVEAELQKRLNEEKKFKPYVHPQAPFLTTENAWNYFYPEMTSFYETLKNAENAADQDSFQARAQLYLAEKKFPSSMLRRVLQHQERQYNWLIPDPELNQNDLSLFGYETLNDWFGANFIKLVSKFIINAAIVAESKGYDVSRSEVLSDFFKKTELSYQKNKNNPNLGVANPEEYFNELLRRMNMDQSRAIKVWRQVLLFRRYFHDVGNTALADNLTSKKFNEYAQKNASLDIYRLPEEFHLNDYDALQKFEIYLNAVAKCSKDDPLALPTTFLSSAEVSKNYPELVQKRYLLEIKEVDKKKLYSHISIKQLWNWEVDDQNWKALKKEFPDLATKKDSNREERFAALDQLDNLSRVRVDDFAKSAIVKSHPEWFEDAFEKAQSTTHSIGIRSQGGLTPFAGLHSKEKREELISLLDKAPLNTEPEKQSKLASFSADQQTFYRIKVKERDAQPQILTFKEASKDDTLRDLKTKILEKHYLTIREKNEDQYQKEDKSWKSFESVQDQVATNYFDSTLKSLEKLQKNLSKEEKKVFSKDEAANFRFYSYLQKLKAKLEKDPSSASQLATKMEDMPETSLKKAPKTEQWKPEMKSLTLDQRSKEGVIEGREALLLSEGSWSEIKTPVNGDLVFYQVKSKGKNLTAEQSIARQTERAQQLLSSEVQRILMRSLLKEMVSKDTPSKDIEVSDAS